MRLPSSLLIQALLRGRHVREELVFAVREDYEKIVCEIEKGDNKIQTRCGTHVIIVSRIFFMLFFCFAVWFVGQRKRLCVSLYSQTKGSS